MTHECVENLKNYIYTTFWIQRQYIFNVVTENVIMFFAMCYQEWEKQNVRYFIAVFIGQQQKRVSLQTPSNAVLHGPWRAGPARWPDALQSQSECGERL